MLHFSFGPQAFKGKAEPDKDASWPPASSHPASLMLDAGLSLVSLVGVRLQATDNTFDQQLHKEAG